MEPQMGGDTLVPVQSVYKHIEQWKKWPGTLAVTQCVTLDKSNDPGP